MLNAAGADDTDGVVALLAGDAHDKTAVGLVRELVLGILAVVGLCAEPRLLLQLFVLVVEPVGRDGCGRGEERRAAQS